MLTVSSEQKKCGMMVHALIMAWAIPENKHGWGVEDMEFPARGIEKIECGNSRGQ